MATPDWVFEGIAKEAAAKRKPEVEFNMRFSVVTVTRDGEVNLWEYGISHFSLAVDMAIHKTKPSDRDGYENNIHHAFIVNSYYTQSESGKFLTDNPLAAVISGRLFIDMEAMKGEEESAQVLMAYMRSIGKGELFDGQ